MAVKPPPIKRYPMPDDEIDLYAPRNSRDQRIRAYYNNLSDSYGGKTDSYTIEDFINLYNDEKSVFDVNKNKLNASYMYKKYRVWGFQIASYFLMIAVIVLGIFIENFAINLNAEYGVISALARDDNMLASVEKAMYIRDNDMNETARQEARRIAAAERKLEQEEEAERILAEQMAKYEMRYIDQNAEGMPNGCEVVSLAMALSRYIPNITPQEISEKYLPRVPAPAYDNGVMRSSDPADFYIGDPSGKGYGIFARGLAKAARDTISAYGLSVKVTDISGCSEDELLAYVKAGTPVIVWNTIGQNPVSWGSSSWHLPTGVLYRYPGNEHVVVLADVSDAKLKLFDPISGIRETDRNLFLQRWNEIGPTADQTRQAIVIG